MLSKITSRLKMRGVNVHKKSSHIVFILLFAITGAFFVYLSNAATPFPTTRNVYKWPFSQKSVWNMPIGSNAVYKPTGFTSTNKVPDQRGITVDKKFIAINPSDPIKTVRQGDYSNHPKQPTNNSGNGTAVGTQVHIPSSLTADGKLNGAAAMLVKGSKYDYVEGNRLWLEPSGTDPRVQYSWSARSLKGNGWNGGTGGGSQGAVGGTIRKGELTSGEPIRHALRLNVWGSRFLSRKTSGGCDEGYRWPALRADASYNKEASHTGSYNGTTDYVCMGSLLAIKPNEDLSWITSKKIRKLAEASRDYGMYIVDNTAWDVWGINVEHNATDEVLNPDIASKDKYFEEFERLVLSLQAVTNNSPSSIGGGGTPRAPLAPCFDDEPNCSNSDPEPTPEDTNNSSEPKPADPEIVDHVSPLEVSESFTQGASIVSSSTVGGTFTADKAVDGNYTDDASRWTSARNDGETLTVNLGSSKVISKIGLIVAKSTTKDYQILTSKDGTKFEIAAEGVNQKADSTNTIYSEFAPREAQYIQFKGLSRWNENYGHSLFEIGIYATEVQAFNPIRINSGGQSVTDSDGNNWQADGYYIEGGGTYTTTNDIIGTTNDAVFQSERWCPAGYEIPISTKNIQVKLLFAEINPRQRVFNASIEGVKVLDNYSISNNVGDFTADTKVYNVNVADGSVSIRFESVTGCPKISGIEILEQGISADTQPPSVSITSPAANSKVQNTVKIVADANDNNAVDYIDFYLNSQLLGKTTKSVYEYSFDSLKYNNGEYELKAVAFDTSGNSSANSISIIVDNVIADTQPPTAPGNLGASSIAHNSVSLNWTSSSDNVAVKDYEIYRNGNVYARTSNISYVDVNVQPNTSYEYYVIARDAALNKSSKSNILNVQTKVAPDTSPPTTPNLALIQNVPGVIEFKWSSTDNVGVSKYLLRRNGAYLQETKSTSHIDNTVSSDTQYEYSVLAYDAAGNISAPGKISIRSVAIGDTTPPSNPYGLYGWQRSRSKQVQLFWKPSSGDEIVRYKVYRNQRLLATVDSLDFGDGTVSRGQTYTYYIAAIDQAGNESKTSNYLTVSIN